MRHRHNIQGRPNVTEEVLSRHRQVMPMALCLLQDVFDHIYLDGTHLKWHLLPPGSAKSY